MEWKGRELGGKGGRGEWRGEDVREEEERERERDRWRGMSVASACVWNLHSLFFYSPPLTSTMFPSWHCVCVVLTCISPVLSLCCPNPNSPSTPPSLTLSNHTLSLTLCKSTLGHSWPLLSSVAPLNQRSSFLTLASMNGHVRSINAYFHGNAIGRVRGGFGISTWKQKLCVCLWDEAYLWVWDYSVWTETDHRESGHTQTNTHLQSCEETPANLKTHTVTKNLLHGFKNSYSILLFPWL